MTSPATGLPDVDAPPGPTGTERRRAAAFSAMATDPDRTPRARTAARFVVDYTRLCDTTPVHDDYTAPALSGTDVAVVIDPRPHHGWAGIAHTPGEALDATADRVGAIIDTIRAVCRQHPTSSEYTPDLTWDDVVDPIGDAPDTIRYTATADHTPGAPAIVVDIADAPATWWQAPAYALDSTLRVPSHHAVFAGFEIMRVLTAHNATTPDGPLAFTPCVRVNGTPIS